MCAKTGAETGMETGVEQSKSEEEEIAEQEKQIIAREMKSEYWNKDLPGHEGWTTGQLISQLRECGEWDPKKVTDDTPENLFNLMLKKVQDKK